MHLTWLGHSGFRMETGGQVILIDPWFTGNPVFPQDRKDEAVQDATAILLTHGHFDHAQDIIQLAKDTGLTVYGTFDLMNYWAQTEGIDTMGWNKGGTVRIGDVAITMVNASHSSSLPGEGTITYGGPEVGYMIETEGRTIYLSGDTDIMADMALVGVLHRPEIGILCAGGRFTMDMRRAAWAARTYFDFSTVVPCHYRTFPALEQSADALRDGLPGVDVRTPEVMERIEI